MSKSRLIFCRIPIFLFAIALASSTAGATTYYWDCSATSPTSGSDTGITSVAFSSTQGNNNGTTTLITTTSASSGYAGASGTSNFGAACKTGALTTASSTYFEVTLTPASGFAITLTSVSLGSRSTSTGPSNITVFSSIDSYAASIGSYVVLANSAWASNSIVFSGGSLVGAASSPVTLRIYGSDGAGNASANTANWRIDDVNLTVAASAGSACTNPPITTQPTDQTVCAGSPAQFTVATSATSPTYLWRLNGAALSNGGTISGATLSTLTVTPTGSSQSVAAGTGYDCVVTASGCSSNSQRRALTVYDTSVGGAAAPATTPICTNTSASINLTGQTGAIVKWQTSPDNATWSDIVSTNNPYTTGNLAVTTYFRAIVQNGSCTTATSASAQVSLTTSVTPVVSLAVSPSNTVYAGTSVTFTATPTYGGTSPTYAFKVNGSTLQSGSSSTYTTSSLADGDQVQVIMTSNDPCRTQNTANSNVITMTIVPPPLAAWDFTGASTVDTWPASVFSAALDSTNVVSRGTGAPASSGANSFRTTGFQNNGISTVNTDYFEIALSALPGYTISLSTIDAQFNGTATFVTNNNDAGVTNQFAYSTDGINFALIGSPVTVTTLPPVSIPQISLTGVSALQNVPASTTVYLRFYATGQTTTGGWGYYSPAAGSYGLSIGGTVATTGPILTIRKIERVGSNDIRITWIGTGGTTNRVQVTPGLANGSYTNNFTDIAASVTNLPGSGAVTNSYTETGGATNKPSRFYRVRQTQ
jgi:hypothetical protein